MKFLRKLLKKQIVATAIKNIPIYAEYYTEAPESLIRACQDVVFACVSLNANAVASVPLRFFVSVSNGTKLKFSQTRPVTKDVLTRLSSSATTYRKTYKNVEELVEHPIITLLNKVNEDLTQHDLIKITCAYMDVLGNAFWRVKKENGTPVAIDVIPSQNVYFENDQIIFRKGLMTEVLDPTTIIHFRTIGLERLRLGVSPLEKALGIINLRNLMTQYEQALLRNAGVPSMILTQKDSKRFMEDDEKEAIEEKWRSLYGGVNNAGKPVVLGGDLDVKVLSSTPRDLNFLLGRKYLREEICAVFGVPISMLTSDSVNRANAEAGLYQHAVYAVKPRCSLIEQKINEKLCPMFDEAIFCAFDDPVPENLQVKLEKRKVNLEYGVTTIDEERQFDGLPPVGLNKPLIAQNRIPMGEVATEGASEELARKIANEILNKLLE